MTPRPNESWILTYSGRKFYPYGPQSCDIEPIDIAHALANRCRYLGHTRRFYSVAEHSVYVSEHVPLEFALEALLHDAAEAYLVDLPRPLRSTALGTLLEGLEQDVREAIAGRFGVPAKTSPVVDEIDARILVDELILLNIPRGVYWDLPYSEGLGVWPSCWVPEVAEVAWMDRYQELTAHAERPAA